MIVITDFTTIMCTEKKTQTTVFAFAVKHHMLLDVRVW